MIKKIKKYFTKEIYITKVERASKFDVLNDILGR